MLKALFYLTMKNFFQKSPAGFTPLDQSIKLAPVAKGQRDYTGLVYAGGFIGLTVLLYSDAMTVAHSLLTGYPFPIPYALGFGIILVIDLNFWGVMFAAKNLFAFRSLAREIWGFYLTVTLLLGSTAMFGSWLVKTHIDALGAKNRKILSPYDYSRNHALIAAEKNVQSLHSQLNSADSAIFSLARAASQAAIGSVAFVQIAKDTSLSKQSRANQLYYAGRANRSQAGITTTLSEMQKQRWALSSQLMIARDKQAAVFDSLSRRYAGKSAEDVIEGDMGVSLKGNVAWMTQIGAFSIFVLFVMLGAAKHGKLFYHPFKYVSAFDSLGGDKKTGEAASETQLDGIAASQASPDFVMPARHTDESKRQWALRVARMYANNEFPEYINATYLSARLNIAMGTFSKLVHGRLGKTYFSKNGKAERVEPQS